MVDAQQNLNGSRDMTTPLLGACQIWAIYLQSLPTTKIWKAMQKIENGVVWVVMGHSRSLKITLG